MRHGGFLARRMAAALALATAIIAGSATAEEKVSPPAVVRMPPWCNTPDGMTLMDDGNVLLSCPNFNDTTYPGVIMKLDRANALSIFFSCPVHPGTKRGCPMGLDVGPDGHVYYADNQYFYDKNHASRLMRVVMEKGQPVRGEVAVEGLKLANAVAWHGDAVYVSDTFFDIEGKPGMSGVYRFTRDELASGVVKVTVRCTGPSLARSGTQPEGSVSSTPSGRFKPSTVSSHELAVAPRSSRMR
jgi:hypothetical protein